MDLVCLIDNKEAALHASDLVAMIGDLLERGQFPSLAHSTRHDLPRHSNLNIRDILANLERLV